MRQYISIEIHGVFNQIMGLIWDFNFDTNVLLY